MVDDFNVHKYAGEDIQLRYCTQGSQQDAEHRKNNYLHKIVNKMQYI